MVPVPANADASDSQPSSVPSSLEAGPLRVVAVGDSVPSGYGQTTNSYVDMVAQGLATSRDRTVDLANYSADGEGTDGLIQDLGATDEQADLHNADYIVVEIGANDFDSTDAENGNCSPVRTSGCYNATMTHMRNNVHEILSRINSYVKDSAHIVVLGYWNVFKDGTAGQSSGSDFVTQGRQLTQWVNSEIKQQAQQIGATYVDIYTPFVTSPNISSLLQADGDHPSTAGHKLIANEVLQTLGETERVS